jgi:hypothetical protein
MEDIIQYVICIFGVSFILYLLIFKLIIPIRNDIKIDNEQIKNNKEKLKKENLIPELVKETKKIMKNIINNNDSFWLRYTYGEGISSIGRGHHGNFTISFDKIPAEYAFELIYIELLYQMENKDKIANKEKLKQQRKENNIKYNLSKIDEL